MAYSVEQFFEALASAIRSSDPFIVALHRMIDWCSEYCPHSDWEVIEKLDFSKDPKGAKAWFVQLVDQQPCPFEVQGIYFGLAERGTASGEEYAQLYGSFLGQYDGDGDPTQWLFGDKKHYPENEPLKVANLKRACLRFNRANGRGVGSDGYYLFGLAYATLLVKEFLTPACYARLATKTDAVGIFVGWDCGDTVRCGELTSAGFQPQLGRMI
ncbi:MAG: hypothetical protein QM790_17660 [Nibricoccus sp.]